jgi:ATP-dependent DNA helicase DinG
MSLIEETRRALSADGPLARHLPSFRERKEQIALAMTVAAALAENRHVSAEAGTGSGKSYAYLVPAILSGQRIMIATATVALQSQIARDLPLLQRALGPFDFAVIKGASHYLCRRDLERAKGGTEYGVLDAPGEDDLAALDPLLADPSWGGDLDLVATLSGRARAAVAADADTCTGQKCPFAGSCYWRAAKEQAREAQIVVANQALCAVALARNPRTLPEHDAAVIDEAHSFVAAVRDQLTLTITPSRISRLLRELRRLQTASQGQPAISRKEVQRSEVAAKNVEQTEAGLWGQAQLAVAQEQERRGQVINVVLPELLHAPGQQLGRAAADLYAALPAVARGEEVASGSEGGGDAGSDAELLAAWEKLGERLLHLVGDLRAVFHPRAGDGLVRALSCKPGARGQEVLAVTAQPIDVAPVLRDRLFSQRPVIATSATLATGEGNFAYFRQQSGMPDPPASLNFYAPHVFDFRHQALLYVPRDLEPVTRSRGESYEVYRTRRTRYLDSLAGGLLDLVRTSRGRAFLLFTAGETLRSVATMIGDVLRAEGYTALVQGEGASPAELLRQFKAAPPDASPVLFGLRSFMQGVDVAGEQLSLVVIDKLPFAVPDDPLEAAIQDQIAARGGDAFRARMLPEAILLLKQGVGRLIRTETDRGVIAILDSRIHTRDYGAQVVDALPPAPGTTQLAAVRQFFAASEVRAHAS